MNEDTDNEARRNDVLGAPSPSEAPSGRWPVRLAGGADLTPDNADDNAVGNTEFWAPLDAVELVCAPPVLCTRRVGGSGVADEPADDELPVAIDVVDETVVKESEFDSDGAVDPDDREVKLEGLLSVDEEADGLDESEELDDELESDGFANATPGMVATADPTPRATANAPIRPT